MPFWQLFYHLVWTTKNRQPLLSPSIEDHVYGYLAGKAAALGGTAYGIGGTVDHVHIFVSIPPSVSVSRFVGQVKGVASTRLNKSGVSETRFAWQDEYAAFSFDAKRLPNYIAYVKRQKEHHADGTAIPILERTNSRYVGPRLVREPAPLYIAEVDDWRAELMALTTETSGGSGT